MAKNDYNELELQEAIRIQNEMQKHKAQLRKMARPSLLSRYFSALVDFVFMFIGMLIFATFLTNPYLSITHYREYVNMAEEVAVNSNLYDNDEGTLTSKELDIVEYEKVITAYYTTDSYALSKKQYEEYLKEKDESLLFDKDYKLLDNADQKLVGQFYEAVYEEAIDFMKTNPDYIEGMNKSFVIVFIGVLILIVLSSSIFYFLIPMFRKEGETLAQIIFKICVIDTRTIGQVKRWQIFVRFIIILVYIYLFGGVLYVVFNPSLMFLPLLTNVFTIGFSKLNAGIHEYASETMIITKSRTSPDKVFDDIASMYQKKF